LYKGGIVVKADSTKVTRLLKTAKGQIEGVLKMVEEDRYCIDISNQLLATQAILRKVNREILHSHIGSCVQEAFEKGDQEDQQKKVDEIMELMNKITK
jgi:CsoR family transcriptional regulator, copper-sensing transcriptional repressor